MEKSKTFQNLIVWQKAHLFVLEIYKLSNQFPQSEIYTLTSQFRRAAVSIAANITEGFKKREKADKINFLNIAQGSFEECRYYLILAKDLGCGANEKAELPAEETSKLLTSYSKKIMNS